MSDRPGRAGQGAGHHRLAQAHHIAEQHAFALVERMRRLLDRRRLIVQQLLFEFARQADLAQARPRLAREMPGDLDVKLPGGRQSLAGSPALLDDIDQVVRNVDAPAVMPAFVEPGLQLGAGILVGELGVQLALALQAGQGEVAAAEESQGRRIVIVAADKVELGVQRIMREDLDAQPAAAQLARRRCRVCSSLFVGAP